MHNVEKWPKILNREDTFFLILPSTPMSPPILSANSLDKVLLLIATSSVSSPVFFYIWYRLLSFLT